MKNILLVCAVTKFIRISIADKNDNPPYFDKHLYEAEVDENEDIQHTVLTVTANDKDECKLNDRVVVRAPNQLFSGRLNFGTDLIHTIRFYIQ